MYIENIDDINNKIMCNEVFSKYLLKNGASLLGKKENIFYFSNTKRVKDLISNAPLNIKVFGKAVQNG